MEPSENEFVATLHASIVLNWGGVPKAFDFDVEYASNASKASEFEENAKQAMNNVFAPIMKDDMLRRKALEESTVRGLARFAFRAIYRLFPRTLQVSCSETPPVGVCTRDDVNVLTIRPEQRDTPPSAS